MLRISFWVLVLVCVWYTASAQTSSEIDLTRAVVGDDGSQLKDPFVVSKDDPNCERCPILTLGLVIAHALVAQLPEDKDLDPLQKWARGDLAVKIKAEKRATFTVDEITVIKRLVGRLYGPTIINQIYPILDPNAAPPSLK